MALSSSFRRLVKLFILNALVTSLFYSDPPSTVAYSRFHTLFPLNS